MIDRYTTPEMNKIWSEDNKYRTWLKVELAVLEAKAKLGNIAREIFLKIKEQAKFDAARIAEIENEIGHDLQAFVECVQENLDPELQFYFHEDMTSYDTEEPATALIIRQALDLIFKGLLQLVGVLKEKADLYRDLPAIGRTHGQHAQPITLGFKFLNWANALMRQTRFLSTAYEEITFTKLSGTVGMYDGLSPEIEECAIGVLGLKRAPIATQIILRDRHAHVINCLAVLAGVLEHIALNIRLLAQTEIGELEEPFREKQKGSSRMPHKKNTVLTERICGLMRYVQVLPVAALSNIPTWHERDISHSSVERIIFPDSFSLIHYALRIMTRVIEGLVINDDKIRRNLDFTKGVVSSADIYSRLKQKGMNPEEAYRLAQQSAFEALERSASYSYTVRNYPEIMQAITGEELCQIFDLRNKLRHIKHIFKRFGL